MLQLRQVENEIKTNYFKFVTLRDSESNKNTSEIENLNKTRGLVAYYLKNYSGCSDPKIMSHITDGFNDQGIDGIFYNHNDKILHIIQTKWVNNGTSGLDLGDMHKMIGGVRKLIVPDLAGCNPEIQALSPEINAALLEPNIKVVLAIVATTIQPIPQETKEIFDSFLTEQNIVSNYLSYEYINIKNLHETLANGNIEIPVDADILIRNWGDIKAPLKAVYGQINGKDLALLLDNHGKRVLSPNIRYFLGKTEVNDSIIDTASVNPELFWYFNNGITAIAKTLGKKPIGGSSHESGIFECKELYIVNGAQTTGSLLDAQRNGIVLDDVYVNIRVIEISDDNEQLGVDVTRNNNTQNRIDSRDFVSLDPIQDKIYQELIIDKIYYTYKSGDIIPEGNEGFSFEEGAIAMACSLGSVELMVQAKREVSKLWQSIDKAPYKILFNSGLEGPKLWEKVKFSRKVEQIIKSLARTKEGRERLVLVHGNRFILMLSFMKSQNFILLNKREPNADELEIIVTNSFAAIKNKIDADYSQDQLASLFKNKDKCKIIKNAIGI